MFEFYDFSVTQSSGSVWVSDENRPEYFTQQWRKLYGPGEPNQSGVTPIIQLHSVQDSNLDPWLLVSTRALTYFSDFAVLTCMS